MAAGSSRASLYAAIALQWSARLHPHQQSGNPTPPLTVTPTIEEVGNNRRRAASTAFPIGALVMCSTLTPKVWIRAVRQAFTTCKWHERGVKWPGGHH